MTAGASKMKLGDLFLFKNGRSFKKEEWSQTGLPIIRIQNLNNSNADFNYFSGEFSNDILIGRNDLLFSWSGTVGSSFGSHLWKGETGVLNQHIFKVGFKREIDKKYAYYALQFITEEIEKSVSGAVGLVHITKEKLNDFTIPYPAISAQQRIVSTLDQAFEDIATATANAEKNLANARELFQSELQAVFTNKREDWLEKPLGELCSLITKGSSPKWQGISYVDKPGILFVTSENVGEYHLIMMDKPKYVEEKFNIKDKKSILRKGDVLTNIVGASIGRTAIYDLDDGANINQAVCLLRCNSTLLNNRYLTYLLNSPVLIQILHDNEVNNARANLSLGFFSQLPVPLPSVAEQRKIVGRFDEVHAETKKLEAIYQQKLVALNELKKAILNQAFTGQLH